MKRHAPHVSLVRERFLSSAARLELMWFEPSTPCSYVAILIRQCTCDASVASRAAELRDGPPSDASSVCSRPSSAAGAASAASLAGPASLSVALTKRRRRFMAAQPGNGSPWRHNLQAPGLMSGPSRCDELALGRLGHACSEPSCHQSGRGVGWGRAGAVIGQPGNVHAGVTHMHCRHPVGVSHHAARACKSGS